MKRNANGLDYEIRFSLFANTKCNLNLQSGSRDKPPSTEYSHFDRYPSFFRVHYNKQLFFLIIGQQPTNDC
jgi:hypothetical protein